MDRQSGGVRINEVLAANESVLNVGGQHPDLIELYNSGTGVVDLSGMSLSDDPLLPRRYLFPTGTKIAPDSYLVLSTVAGTPGANLTLNFGLRREGEAVYLYDTPANGGKLLDSIEFGLQIDDFSLGRIGPDRQWQLSQPTLGRPNIAQPTGQLERCASTNG